MATFKFSKQTFSVNLSGRERRALSRPSLVFEMNRLLSAELSDFPEKATLGVKISKSLWLLGSVGEYRSNSKRSLVFGRQGGSGQALRIRISHPSIDEIWVCGPQAAEIETRLREFIKAA